MVVLGSPATKAGVVLAKPVARQFSAELVWWLHIISARKEKEHYERIDIPESVEGDGRIAEALGFSF
jgi:hypothetical protein